MTPEQLVLLRHMRRDKASIRKCAAAFGVSKSTIARHVLEFGQLKPRLPITEIARAIKPYGFVYIFAAQNLLKIGMSTHSPMRRWHSIKTANPWLERPLYISPPLGGRMMKIEKECHAALAEYRRCGEWFECDRMLALDTVRRIAE